METHSALLHILKEPSNRVLFIVDTTGSLQSGEMHQELFEYLVLLRAASDPTGERSIAITDAFSAQHNQSHYLAPCILDNDTQHFLQIPPSQVKFGGGQHPLVLIGKTNLFKQYQPTHIVFASDLMEIPPLAAQMPLPSGNIAFMLWQGEGLLKQFRNVYKACGAVLPFLSRQELGLLRANHTATLIEQATSPAQSRHPGRRF